MIRTFSPNLKMVNLYRSIFPFVLSAIFPELLSPSLSASEDNTYILIIIICILKLFNVERSEVKAFRDLTDLLTSITPVEEWKRDGFPFTLYLPPHLPNRRCQRQ